MSGSQNYFRNKLTQRECVCVCPPEHLQEDPPVKPNRQPKQACLTCDGFSVRSHALRLPHQRDRLLGQANHTMCLACSSGCGVRLHTMIGSSDQEIIEQTV